MKLGKEIQVIQALILNYIMLPGVWDEWRAWTTSSELYLELIQSNEQTPLTFMDQILGNNRLLTNEQLQQIWKSYLFKNFEKPTTGLFASPLLRDALNSLLSL